MKHLNKFNNISEAAKQVRAKKVAQYEYIDECPSYKEFKVKVKELNKVINSLKRELKGDSEEYIIEELIELINLEL